jgi:hypothetical protein
VDQVRPEPAQCLLYQPPVAVEERVKAEIGINGKGRCAAFQLEHFNAALGAVPRLQTVANAAEREVFAPGISSELAAGASCSVHLVIDIG